MSAQTDDPENLYKIITENIKVGVTHGIAIGILVVLGVGIKWKFFGTTKKRQDRAKELLTSLGLTSVIPTLTEYELIIASQLIKPSDIDVSFEDVAGLESTVDSIKSNVILPLLGHKFLKKKSHFLEAPKGVLLYGPPGCGKTMVAKATAKEANARFLNLEIPTLTDKWYGESQKLAHAVFTLAQKIQPCIIFIDEIDTFLRARGKFDHEVTAMVKAQFMILWDGLQSQDNKGILIMGATNRPFDVDEAILRRMPKKLEVSKPDSDQRKKILELLLEKEDLVDVDFTELALLTDGFSGSDLKELCRNAISSPVREKEKDILQLVKLGDEEGIDGILERLRKVNFGDFKTSLDSMNESSKWKLDNNELSKHLDNHCKHNKSDL